MVDEQLDDGVESIHSSDAPVVTPDATPPAAPVEPLLVPVADAGDEAWKKFYTAWGRPEKPDAYTLPALPEGSSWNDPMVNGMRQVAHEAGLNQKEWEKVVSGYVKLQQEQTAAVAQTMQTTETALRQEWGGAYNKRIGLAQRAIKTMGGDDVFEVVETSSLGNHPGFIRMMARIGEHLAEEGVIDATSGGSVSKEQAMEMINQITASPEYLNPNAPNHRQAVEKAQKLFEVVYN
jgi:hypothetical protein